MIIDNSLPPKPVIKYNLTNSFTPSRIYTLKYTSKTNSFGYIYLSKLILQNLYVITSKILNKTIPENITKIYIYTTSHQITSDNYCVDPISVKNKITTSYLNRLLDLCFSILNSHSGLAFPASLILITDCDRHPQVQRALMAIDIQLPHSTLPRFVDACKLQSNCAPQRLWVVLTRPSKTRKHQLSAPDEVEY